MCTAQKYLVKLVAGAMLLVMGQTQPNAQSEDDRVKKAIQPQTIQLRECYLRTAVQYASKTCEPASVIVEAVFEKCFPEETQLNSALIMAAPYERGSGAEAFMQGTREGGRKIMLAAILDARAKLGHCFDK